jgi:hypothetical protein
MLRTVANEMGDEAIEISSSETVSDDEGDYIGMRARFRHDLVGQITDDERKEVSLTCIFSFTNLCLVYFRLPLFSTFYRKWLLRCHGNTLSILCSLGYIQLSRACQIQRE